MALPRGGTPVGTMQRHPTAGHGSRSSEESLGGWQSGVSGLQEGSTALGVDEPVQEGSDDEKRKGLWESQEASMKGKL